MLSVVLYGRNDSHGYNLHKRGAVSLNAIAHLLRDPDDELIFVDYNTPDDLPTFPEAIADTLTAQAREKLRILRVRPAQHARFAPHTHLVALEPVARNVAIRRSNPANRWLLSTNTDMIFVPRQDGASLGDLIRGLDDGFYHLPRFELPEALWESLDRADAPGIIGAAGEWGERFHLDEVVRSSSDNLFDGPGDFQLFLRDDLFAIGGFDERMLKGWHVDANVARRMRFLRGKVSSAESLLRGYHCDHTRQASPYHKGDRVENDPVRYVDELKTADLREQMQSFGLAGEQVEELRLGAASSARYLQGIAAAVPAGRTGALQTAYVAEAYGGLGYPLEHVLPYLLDLVSCIPQDATIGYLGARSDTFMAFCKGWKAMGGTSAPLLSQTAPWLGGGSLDLDQWADAADVFVFEVGAENATVSSELSAQERARLWQVNRGMAVVFAADERRQAAGSPARRAIVVNAINNSFEAQLFRHLSVTLTPFSSRIRHGFIVDPERAPAGHPALAEAAKALGRDTPFGPVEAALCRKALEAAIAAEALTPEARSLAGAIAALTAARAPGFPSPSLAAPVLAQLAAAIPPAADFPAGVGLNGHAANRLACVEDWSDPAFLRMAYALFPNRRHDEPKERIAWTWERVTLALNLDAALPLVERPRVLVAAALPELLAFMLSNLGAQVDIADPLALAEGRLAAVDWRAELVETTFAVPASAEPLGLISDFAAEIATGLRYDAVLLPQNGLFCAGRDGAARLLREAAALLRPGGQLGLTPFSLVNDVAPEFFGDNLSVDLLREGRWAALMGERAGLAPFGGVEPTLSPGTLDTLPPQDGDRSEIPALVVRDGPALRVPSAFAFTLTGPAADEAGWEAVNQAIRTGVVAGDSTFASASRERLSTADIQRLQGLAAEVRVPSTRGSVLRHLTPGSGVESTPRAVRVPAEGRAQLFLSGALGRLAPGVYDLRVQGSGEGAALQAFVITRDGVAASGRVQFEDGEWLMSFEAPGPIAGPVALALHTQGGAGVEILEVAID